jgi:endo-1,3-1,4-beta-glycanase ExoK
MPMKSRILAVLGVLAIGIVVVISSQAIPAMAYWRHKPPQSTPTSVARTPTSVVSPTTTTTSKPKPTSTTTSGNPTSTINLSDWNNTSHWERADGYGNGGDFNVGWRADHATTSGSNLIITLDNQSCPSGCSGSPYASAELDSQARYSYGTYTVQMQAAKGSGIVSTFFTYINTGSNGQEKNDEIDVEIPGARPTTLEATYYKLGKSVEYTIQLPFDASAAMHTYSIQWLPNSISWIVDGQTLYTANGSPSTMPTTPSSFILNFWTGTSALNSWLGPFSYTSPLHVTYGSASFTPAS